MDDSGNSAGMALSGVIAKHLLTAKRQPWPMLYLQPPKSHHFNRHAWVQASSMRVIDSVSHPIHHQRSELRFNKRWLSQRLSTLHCNIMLVFRPTASQLRWDINGWLRMVMIGRIGVVFNALRGRAQYKTRQWRQQRQVKAL